MYVVHHIAQWMSQRRSSLRITTILRYLKGALNLGTLFQRSSSPSTIETYSIVAWLGCSNSRQSTNGFYIFLGSNLIF